MREVGSWLDQALIYFGGGPRARSSPRRLGAGPGRRGGLSTQREEAGYRTRVEVLRDFLRAVRQEPKKTRIIGLANLNPSSFRRYLNFGIAFDLVRPTPGGFRLTVRAEAVLDSIERLLAKTAEFESILGELYRSLGGAPLGQGPRSSSHGRTVSRIALAEIALPHIGRSGGLVSPGERFPDPGLPIDSIERWWLRDGQAPVVGPRLDSGARGDLAVMPASVNIRRSARARSRK